MCYLYFSLTQSSKLNVTTLELRNILLLKKEGGEGRKEKKPEHLHDGFRIFLK